MGGGRNNSKIDFVYGSAYHTLNRKRKKGIKPLFDKKSSEYKYKVLVTLNKVKGDVIYYTYDNTKLTGNGKSFLVPKVIFTQGSGMEMAIIDEKGEYLLTEFAYGIRANNYKELDEISKAVKCKEFTEFTRSLSTSSVLNKQIFKYLRKDFYKYFNRPKIWQIMRNLLFYLFNKNDNIDK